MVLLMMLLVLRTFTVDRGDLLLHMLSGLLWRQFRWTMCGNMCRIQDRCDLQTRRGMKVRQLMGMLMMVIAVNGWRNGLLLMRKMMRMLVIGKNRRNVGQLV